MVKYFQTQNFNILFEKLGLTMNKKMLIKKVISESNGIAKASQLIDAGLSKTDVRKFATDGYITRVRHGYYSLADCSDISEEQLIQSLLPEAIVCVESALFYYGYIDFAPRVWSLAVPRSMTKEKLKIDAIPFKSYFIQKKFLELGKTLSEFDGVKLPVYDRERTICDCFKYRTKLDNEIFNKAVNAYAADSKKNLANLSKYAKEMGVYKKMMSVMEVLLNG